MSKARVFDRAFKLSAVHRILAGENVSALSRELAVLRKDLYVWRDRFRAGGPAALRGRGRPSKASSMELASPLRPAPDPLAEGAASLALAQARRRIGELERKVGQQQIELDFFQRALRRVRATRRPSDGPGAPSSSPKSRR